MTEAPSLSRRLKTETAVQHERMHGLMAQADPFASRDRYARYVAAQYRFQRDVQHLFADTRVRAAVADLDMRGRADASRADLADLGQAVPDDSVPATAGVAMPEALGWLYVSEGSTLGAAFLFKEAQERLGLDASFGARHLAASPEGRAAAWRRFVASLDAVRAPSVQDAVVRGALAAFDRFGTLLQHELSLPAANA